MIEINNHKYSREEFEGYKRRAVIQFQKDNQQYYTTLHVYTTDEDRENVLNVIKSRTKKGVKVIDMINFATKEQDDSASELINEWLNEEI